MKTAYDIDGDTTPAEAVIGALAEVTDVDPLDMKPLNEHVDVDALDRLLESRDGTTESESTVLAFSVDDVVVFARNDGTIVVCDSDEPADRVPVFDRADARTDFHR